MSDFVREPGLAFNLVAHSKVWDTFTGTELATFPHNHIVRSVDISPSGSHIITGGQEKKLRLFDLERPEAEPTAFVAKNGGLAHEGTIRGLVWDDERAQVVSAGEDRVVRFVQSLRALVLRKAILQTGGGIG